MNTPIPGDLVRCRTVLILHLRAVYETKTGIVVYEGTGGLMISSIKSTKDNHEWAFLVLEDGRYGWTFRNNLEFVSRA